MLKTKNGLGGVVMRAILCCLPLLLLLNAILPTTCVLIPDQTKYRLSLLVEKEIKGNLILGKAITDEKLSEIKNIIYHSVSLTIDNGSDAGNNILEQCNKEVEKTLSKYKDETQGDFMDDLCYNILNNHVKLVVNRQHYAENIYEVVMKHFGTSNSTDFVDYYKSIGQESKMSKQIITPELSYMISDLFPIKPDHKDCVIVIMRVMSLPLNVSEKDADLMCKEILSLRKEEVYYKSGSGSSELIDNSVKITAPKSKLTPFDKTPPFIDVKYAHGIAGIRFSSERVSSSKKAEQGFNSLLSLPFVNSPVPSIKDSEKQLSYSHGNNTSNTDFKKMPELNGREEMIFNDDVFSGLILPCRTLNYEGKLLASLLFHYSVYNKIPLTVEEVCIVCMRTVYIVSISIPKDPNCQRKNSGIINGEIINPFIPTCIHSFMTLSTYLPNGKFSTEYLPSLVTSEAASRALGKLCGKVMSRYIQIFGMIGIGNHNISCTPGQLLLLNSIQSRLWTNYNALFSSNEIAQIACRVNLDTNASQASSECSSLLDKITTNDLSRDDTKLLCQDTVKFLQPQPLVTTPILFTISNILKTAVESVGGPHYIPNEKRPLYLVDYIRISKKFVLFIRPKINKKEYTSSCKALVKSNLGFLMLSEQIIHKICKITFTPIKSIIIHYYTPQELQKYHRKQFLQRSLFIKRTISSFSKIIEKKLQINK
ncbi:hypothetical protein FG386_002726 [Cryptosporidium ryanae]|uniref:uncharacterized protein n=1 Tax=Cryptosporidium ryanae TaxID=515981 RepID=UPI00351A5AF1|nr:hypothetical protein FG386_002726 [Cryptosporidium ryanae]